MKWFTAEHVGNKALKEFKQDEKLNQAPKKPVVIAGGVVI